jgi:AcrR family transcriptional regulator
VSNELLDVAQALFAEKGYEQVTIEEIAEAAGISRRSFFRYFASKDALVLGKLDRQGEQFVEALSARPLDETLWVALRRMADGAMTYVSDPELGRRASEMERVIHSSTTLHAGFLQRMEHTQRLVTDAARERERARGSDSSDLAIAATVAAAFSALMAAAEYARSQDIPMAQALDEAMAALASLQ